jgi:hypothetical protein
MVEMLVIFLQHSNTPPLQYSMIDIILVLQVALGKP